jgi:SPP1 family phage portal protein
MASLTQQSGLDSEFIVKAESEIPRDLYKRNNAYYEGENTAILMQDAKKKPDNRVPIAYVNRLIKDLLGYAYKAGNTAVKVRTDDDGEVDKTFEKVVKLAETKNKTELLNTKINKSQLKHGIGYELVWTERIEGKETFQIKDADIPVGEGFPIWDSSLSTVPKLSKFIRYYDRTEKQDIVVDKNTISLPVAKYANVYIKGGYEIWKYNDDDKDKRGKAINDSDKAEFVVFIDQPFKDLQVIPYQANDEKIPYWQPVKKIIDQYDKIMSGNMNEADRFNDTLLMFMTSIDAKAKEKIDEMGVIHNLSAAVQEGLTDIWPRFLERNVPVEHAKLMLTTLETLIYTIIGVPSFLSETFGTASGVALLFRLIGLEYSAVEIDVYFDLGLLQRLELYKQAVSSDLKFYNEKLINEKAVENITATISHTRNLPLDLTTILDQALQLKALGLSDEIVLGLLPKQVIPDLKEALKAIEDKKKERLAEIALLTAKEDDEIVIEEDK